jgi:hypothetical protein
MQTVHQTRPTVNVHYTHGADRAILGLSRDGCRNAEQRRGYEEMTGRIRGYQMLVTEGEANDQVDRFAAELQARFEMAEQRRSYALMLSGQTETAIAAGSLFEVTVYQGVEVYS